MNWSFLRELSELGAPSLAIFVSGMFVVALQRGWLVPGKYHREVVADREKENDLLRAAYDKVLDSNGMLTRTVLEQNVTKDTTNKLLVALREVAEADR